MSVPIPPPSLQIPPSLEEKCAGPALPSAEPPTVGEVLTFAVEGEAALQICEAKREALVTLLRGTLDLREENARPEPRGLRGFLGF